VLRGSFFLLMGKPGLLAKAAEASAAANRALGGATAREQRHAAALAAWCKGDFEAALRQWEGILAEAPRDVVALKLAHYLHFYLGDAAAMRDSIERVLPGWDESLPGYAAVLGMRAFGLEESGAYAEAERTGRRAVELNPDDPWAVHAVAHVLEMQDRGRDGVAWIRGLERRWDACNNFRYHLWWHLALMHLGLGEAEAALALYDERVWDPASDEYLDLCNDAALLQRLELAGLDVGDRWAAVAAKARGQLAARILVFIDAHYALALAAAKDEQAAAELVGAVRACASGGAGTTAKVAAEVGADLCEGLLAYRAGDFGAAVERLAPLRARLRRIGGSHAQRDLFTQILVDAATRAGRREVARAVLAERTAARPGQRFYRTRFAALGA
jgi:tetratricopeptide (TPR) repeat protein